MRDDQLLIVALLETVKYLHKSDNDAHKRKQEAFI